jgi:hypothetical protein
MVFQSPGVTLPLTLTLTDSPTPGIRGAVAGSAHAAATTGPASGPRPASSHPMHNWTPRAHAASSRRVVAPSAAPPPPPPPPPPPAAAAAFGRLAAALGLAGPRLAADGFGVGAAGGLDAAVLRVGAAPAAADAAAVAAAGSPSAACSRSSRTALRPEVGRPSSASSALSLGTVSVAASAGDGRALALSADVLSVNGLEAPAPATATRRDERRMRRRGASGVEVTQPKAGAASSRQSAVARASASRGARRDGGGISRTHACRRARPGPGFRSLNRFPLVRKAQFTNGNLARSPCNGNLPHACRSTYHAATESSHLQWLDVIWRCTQKRAQGRSCEPVLPRAPLLEDLYRSRNKSANQVFAIIGVSLAQVTASVYSRLAPCWRRL